MSKVTLLKTKDNNLQLAQSSLNRETLFLKNSFCLFQRYVDKKKYFITTFDQEIEKNFDNPNIKIRDIAFNMAMTEKQLYRKAKQYFSITPNKYLRNFRLDHARMLMEKGVPINAISAIVGFTSHSYFNRC
ncbi:MAG: helix-turn-helix domain-containing protein, partial [Cytophagales bacterium]|nr:helix-turn-helix domain-containing protein [Cytophagales bacterium]